MNKKLYCVLSLIPVTACFLCLFFFRQLPGGELWKGYSVLYVPQNVSENLVLETLNQYDVREITCLSNQYLPTELKGDSIEISLLSLNQNAMEYLQKRENYFFDKNRGYKLYYVPVFYKAKLTQAASAMNRKFGTSCGIDSKSSYPFLFPLFALLFAVLLGCFSKKKVLYAFLSVLPFLYTVSFPFLSSEIAVLVSLTVLFVVTNIYGRRDFMKILLKKYVFISLIVFGIFSVFSNGFTTGISFILLLISEYSIIYMYRQIQVLRYNQNNFNPVMIRSSFNVPQYSGKEWLVFGSLLVFTTVSFCYSVFSNGTPSGSDTSGKKITLPSVSSVVKSQELPVLEDFYRWDFNLKSFPYISLNGSDGTDSSSISRFTKTSGGIEKTEDTIVYNDQFKENVYNKIDLLPFNAFEKVMKKQGEAFQAGYSSTGSHRLSIFCIIISFLQFTVILVYFAWILINKGKRTTKIKKSRGRK